MLMLQERYNRINILASQSRAQGQGNTMTVRTMKTVMHFESTTPTIVSMDVRCKTLPLNGPEIINPLTFNPGRVGQGKRRMLMTKTMRVVRDPWPKRYALPTKPVAGWPAGCYHCSCRSEELQW